MKIRKFETVAVEVCEGEGVKDNPSRLVTYYYELKDGICDYFARVDGWELTRDAERRLGG